MRSAMWSSTADRSALDVSGTGCCQVDTESWTRPNLVIEPTYPSPERRSSGEQAAGAGTSALSERLDDDERTGRQ